MFCLGCDYVDGDYGSPQDYENALKLWHKAGALGNAKAYHNIGVAYNNGYGVERDEKKADYNFELAAMGGNVIARYNLGCYEYEKSNWDRAIKHLLISAGGGHSKSVKNIQLLYMNGYGTKEDNSKALQVYQTYISEIRSEQRNEAAAYSDHYTYYPNSLLL